MGVFQLTFYWFKLLYFPICLFQIRVHTTKSCYPDHKWYGNEKQFDTYLLIRIY